MQDVAQRGPSETQRRLQGVVQKVVVIRGTLHLDLRCNHVTIEGLKVALRHPALRHVTNLYVDSTDPEELAAALMQCSLSCKVNGIPVADLKDNATPNVDIGVLDFDRLRFISPFISACTSLVTLGFSLESFCPEDTEWVFLSKVSDFFSICFFVVRTSYLFFSSQFRFFFLTVRFFASS